jgi:ribonuclease HI
MNEDIWYLSTDGAATGNGKPHCRASYGYILISKHDLVELNAIRDSLAGTRSSKIPEIELCCYDGSGELERPCSNQRGELMGALKGFERFLTEGLSGRLIWLSDSQYTLKAIDEWSRNWSKRGIVAEKKNTDLILEARTLLDAIGVFQKIHIRSHKTAPDDVWSDDWLYWFLNDYADKKATCCLA